MSDQFEKKIILGDVPYSLSIEATAYCNLRCTMCANRKLKRKKGYMELDLYKKIIDEVTSVSTNFNLCLNGYGESFLNADIFDMIKYAKDKKIKRVLINTNGMLLTEENIDKLIESNIDCVVISIDGFSKELYESIRVGGDRDTVYRNTEKLLEKIKLHKDCNIYVEIQMIEMDAVLGEKEEWINYWTQKGANIKLKPYMTWGGAVAETNKEAENRTACANINVLEVLWNGEVAYCTGGDVDSTCILGNVYQENVLDIWKKKREFGEKQLVHEFDDLPDVCRKCTDWMNEKPAKHINSNTKGENIL